MKKPTKRQEKLAMQIAPSQENVKVALVALGVNDPSAAVVEFFRGFVAGVLVARIKLDERLREK